MDRDFTALTKFEMKNSSGRAVRSLIEMKIRHENLR